MVMAMRMGSEKWLSQQLPTKPESLIFQHGEKSVQHNSLRNSLTTSIEVHFATLALLSSSPARLTDLMSWCMVNGSEWLWQVASRGNTAKPIWHARNAEFHGHP